MNIQLGAVEETALIPLAVRANETKNKKARIQDNVAVEIIDALGVDTKNLDKTVTHESVVAEGLFMYFSREQTKEILRKITENFPKGYLVVELMRQSMMKEKVHDTVKHTNAKFGWGTDSGEELLSLNAKLELLKETSFSAQMKKSALKSKLLGTIIGNLNNRLAVYRWRE